MLKKSALFVSHLFIESIRRFFEDGVMYRVAALTYTSLLSLAPLMTVCFAILSAFPVFKNMSAELQDFIFKHFVATSGEVIQNYLTYFVNQTQHLSAIGFLSLILVAILMMFNLEQAFNAIWHVPERKKGIQSFLMYWAILTLTPILISTSIIASHYLYTNRWIKFFLVQSHLDLLFPHIFPFISSWALFAILYFSVPNAKNKISYVIIGSGVAAVFFALAKYGFSLYVNLFPSYFLLYGALATIPIFLIWLYTTWVVILYGAVLTYTLGLIQQKKSLEKLNGFLHAYRWLYFFYDAFCQGKDLSISDLIEKDNENYEVEPEYQIQLFLKKGWIKETSNKNYILAKDLHHLNLEAFSREIPWSYDSLDLNRSPAYPFELELFAILKNLQKFKAEIFQRPLAKLFEV